MSSEVITRGNERIKTLLGSLDKVLVKLENILTKEWLSFRLLLPYFC